MRSCRRRRLGSSSPRTTGSAASIVLAPSVPHVRAATQRAGSGDLPEQAAAVGPRARGHGAAAVGRRAPESAGADIHRWRPRDDAACQRLREFPERQPAVAATDVAADAGHQVTSDAHGKRLSAPRPSHQAGSRRPLPV